MTPRIKESGNDPFMEVFSGELFSQLKPSLDTFHLSPDGPSSSLIHPALIKTRLMFEKKSEELVFRSESSGWNLQAYPSLSKAQESIKGDVPTYGDRPWQYEKFLNDSPVEAILDCGPLGAAFLSKGQSFPEPSQKQIHHFMIPVWIDYALSPELWGPQGKWPRFHERLHALFQGQNLLEDQDSPGYYPLKNEARILENHGFFGKLSGHRYLLTMPWDFPLSGLNKLESVIRQEL